MLAAIAVLGTAWALTLGQGDATHWTSYNFTWLDLRPTGDGQINYATCGGAPGEPPQWTEGVENWDASMSSDMDFDNVGCMYPPISQTVLIWEGFSPYNQECTSGTAYACWVPWSWVQDGTWRYLLEAVALFDYQRYMAGTVSDGWRTTISAHEWGHNLNLEDHSEPICTVYLLMGSNPGDLSGTPCMTGPTTEEANSVAGFYGWRGPYDPDADGWDNDDENYIGTDPVDNCPDGTWDDAWPPDTTNDTRCNVLDVLLFKPHIGCSVGDGCYDNRLDLNADGIINVLDILLMKPYVSTQCT